MMGWYARPDITGFIGFCQHWDAWFTRFLLLVIIVEFIEEESFINDY